MNKRSLKDKLRVDDILNLRDIEGANRLKKEKHPACGH